MLSLNELANLADRDGVGVATVERDYAMTHIIASVASQPISERLEFKGGTSLRLCHFPDYRYSADLDLNLTEGLSREEALRGIERALAETRDRLRIPHLALSVGEAAIDFVGARGQRRPERIKLDLSDDELSGGSVARLPVLPRYRDQQPSDGVPTYTLVETLAEKLRCLIQRLQCRDVYDLHHLLCEEAIDPADAWGRFEEKTAHRNLDPNLFWERLDNRMSQYGRRWDDEMGSYVRSYPDFDTLERELRRALRPVGP
jgi:hypothetical protein